MFVGCWLLLLVRLSFLFKFIWDIRGFVFLDVVIGGGDCFLVEFLFSFGFICCFDSVFVLFFLIWFCRIVGCRVGVVDKDFIGIGFIGEMLVGVFEVCINKCV